MNSNSINIKIFIPGLLACQLLFVQNLFAQDSTVEAKAAIKISCLKGDSLNQVKATVTKLDSAGTVIPAKDVEVHVYVKKSFGLLPIEGDNLTTDENGEATVDFPADLPGDASGNVTVIAKVEDNDELGNLETAKSVKWGIPVSNVQTLDIRTLSASGRYAPWPLVIIVTGLVGIVWGVIIYIFYQLIVIKKSGEI